MGRPFYTEQQVQDGRRRLAAAALKLYRSQGYEAVTLKGLGSALGISSATPYRFFDSKGALFEHVRAVVYQSFGDHLEAADPKRGDPGLRLRKIAWAMIDFGLRYPEDYRLIFSMRQPPIAVDSELYVIRRRTMEYVIPICQQLIDSGRMQGDARVQLHLVWAAVHGLISFHVSSQLIHGCAMNDLIEPMLDGLLPPLVARGAQPRTSPRAAKKSRSQPEPRHARGSTRQP